MPVNDELGRRMKDYYENIAKTKLMRRTPVAIRIDGRAFHTFTRGFEKPFDTILMKSMQGTMKYLCENIQGCVFGYTQSDEITLILQDYKELTTDAWFDYEVQKICSISASMATMAFNRYFEENVKMWADTTPFTSEGNKLLETYRNAISKGAMFDARCFNIPKEEVCNLVYWRQLDATRNSIQMVGQANFSHRELQGKSCNMIQDMLLTQKDINWNDFPTPCKRGTACLKKFIHDYDEYGVDWGDWSSWLIDEEMPVLKGEDRQYIENLIIFE